MPTNRLFNNCGRIGRSGDSEWLTSNYFKVNEQKSEFLPIVPESAKKSVNELSFGNPLIQTVNKVQNLGAYVDNHMNMSVNISEIVCGCYFHSHHISQIARGGGAMH